MKQPTAQQATQMRRLQARIEADPIMKRHLAKAKTLFPDGKMHDPQGEQPPLTVMDALGEQMGFALGCLYPDWVDVAWEEGTDEVEQRLRLSEQVLKAHPFYWKQELIKEATSNMNVPDHVIGNCLLPYPAIYVTADMSLFNDPVKDLRIEAMLWSESSAGLEVQSFIADMEAGGIKLDYFRIPHGARFPEECPEETRHNVRQILSMIAFMNSPYVSITKHRADRAARRERDRLLPERPLPEPELAVIQLRAREKRPDATQFGLTGNHPGDTGHWWVRGHIRAQWYAGEKTHRLIWIAPHIRGNIEAPLKKQAYAVVH